MNTIFQRCFLVLLICLSASYLPTLSAQESRSNNKTDEISIPFATQLKQLQQQLATYKQTISDSPNNMKLSELGKELGEFLNDVDELSKKLNEQKEQLQTHLDVLGAEPDPALSKESKDTTDRRKQLSSAIALLTKQIETTANITSSGQDLIEHINIARQKALQSQLSLKSNSIVSGSFWIAIVQVQADDSQKYSQFASELGDAITEAFSADWWFGTILFVIIAILLPTLIRSKTERLFAWIGINKLPSGRLRRSFLTTVTMLITAATLSFAVDLLITALSRTGKLSENIDSFISAWYPLFIFCSIFFGLGRAWLSTKYPSWRLPNIPDPVAKAMRVVPVYAAIILLLTSTFEILNDILNISLAMTLFTNACSALLIAITTLSIFHHNSRIKQKLNSSTNEVKYTSLFSGLIIIVCCSVSTLILLVLLLGYISLARFLAFELVWVSQIFLLTYLSIHLLKDCCEAIFSTETQIGRSLKKTLRLDERYLDQGASLLNAIGKTLLILFAIAAIIGGAFGTTSPQDLLLKTLTLIGEQGLGQLNISFANIVTAILFLVIAIYLLRATRRWLENDFLPKTKMDSGMQVSMLTLFSNLGYAFIILTAFGTLGVEWSKLAWIVSALSVGIGFGLQEIVKNFISGLILLTERPIKVGDLINVGGIEGDIRRINVRATEIQLKDRSTAIIPNSQLLSQNVINSTMGNAMGIASISLTLPLDIDPEQVRDILLDSYNRHESILANPAPSVTFIQIMPTGIELKVSGYVTSPRIISKTKSDLLFDILKQLKQHNIALSSPQSVVIEKPGD